MIKHIEFEWFDGKKVVKDLDKVTIVVGENNSGKTTLLERVEAYYIYDYIVNIDVLNVRSSDWNCFDKKTKQIVNKKTNIDTAGKSISRGILNLSYIIDLVLCTNNKDVTILLDCPENNLSIEWQVNLIDWLIECNPNAQFVIATHSPFIFDNKWDECAFGIGEFIKDK